MPFGEWPLVNNLEDVDQTTQGSAKVLSKTASGGKPFSWQAVGDLSGSANGLTDVDQTTQGTGKVLAKVTSGGKPFSWQTPAVVPTSVDDLGPSQTGNAGKVLSTDGTNASWASIIAGLTPIAVTTSAIALTMPAVGDQSAVSVVDIGNLTIGSLVLVDNGTYAFIAEFVNGFTNATRFPAGVLAVIAGNHADTIPAGASVYLLSAPGGMTLGGGASEDLTIGAGWDPVAGAPALPTHIKRGIKTGVAADGASDATVTFDAVFPTALDEVQLTIKSHNSSVLKIICPTYNTEGVASFKIHLNGGDAASTASVVWTAYGH